MKLAILASHGGSIMQAVIDACAAGTVPAEVVLVISNNSHSHALSRAREHGIATAHLSAFTHPDPAGLDGAILDALASAAAEWVLLAGYMKKLGPRTLEHFQSRILNTHPALLPAFGGKGFFGRRVHEAVIAAGEKESGATVHLVDGDYDHGPVLFQRRVPVCANDTAADLEARVKAAERKLVIDALIELAAKREASMRDASNY